MAKLSPSAPPNLKPRLLFVGTQMLVAGAQTALLAQARWFHAQGYPVPAVFFYDKQNIAGRWRAENPFPIIDLRAWRADGNLLGNGLRLAFGLLRFLRLLLSGKFHAVETFTPHCNLLAIPPAWLARVPVRLATHHGYLDSMPPWLLRLHGRLINRGLATRLVAVSGLVKKFAVEVEKVEEGRVDVILNGINDPTPDALSPAQQRDLRASLDISEGAPLILTAGRLIHQKGHTYLLDAIPEVLEQHPKATFVFAGEGVSGENLVRKSSEMGIEGAVRFLGHRLDVRQLMSSADLFVLPSLWEGLPLALLEAMWLGLPVVATQVEGVVEAVQHQLSGLLVPPKDSRALAAALTRLLRDRGEARSLGEQAAKVVKSLFTTERMCREYEQLFLNSYPPG